MLHFFWKMNKNTISLQKTEGAFVDHYLEFESNLDEHKNILLPQCLNEIRPYFKEIINKIIDSNDHNQS